MGFKIVCETGRLPRKIIVNEINYGKYFAWWLADGELSENAIHYYGCSESHACGALDVLKNVGPPSRALLPTAAPPSWMPGASLSPLHFTRNSSATHKWGCPPAARDRLLPGPRKALHAQVPLSRPLELFQQTEPRPGPQPILTTACLEAFPSFTMYVNEWNWSLGYKDSHCPWHASPWISYSFGSANYRMPNAAPDTSHLLLRAQLTPHQPGHRHGPHLMIL